MLLVASIAAGVLINTVGFLESDAAESGEESSAEVTNRVHVVNTVGSAIESGTTTDTGETEVTEVKITVKRPAAAENVDLGAVSVQWIDDSGGYNILPNGEAADANFAIKSLRDDDGSIAEANVLNDPTDRAVLVFETDEDDAKDDTDNAIGTNLGPGSSSTVTLRTETGGTTTLTLQVPQSLTGKSTVAL
jgi:flagellin FlaB